MKNKSTNKQFLNKKANFNYLIHDTIEAGIVLTGDEIKAIRSGRVSMETSYARILSGELWWIGGNIQVLEGDPQRSRKLLLKKPEIKRLVGATAEKGETIVPIKLYFQRGKAKLLIGLGKGKKKYDKREVTKKRETERALGREIKQS